MDTQTPPVASTKNQSKRRVILAVKLLLAVGIFALILRDFARKDNLDELLSRLGNLHYGWLVPSVLAQLAAIGCAVGRWDLMLRGQGIRAPRRHLLGSFMIGRYFGAVTPGGLGLQGYRLYDIATHTGKVARSTATVAIETLAGQMGFAATVLIGSIFGLEHLGVMNVVLIDGFFLALIVFAVMLIARPTLFRLAGRAVLGGVPTKLETLIDAVCAYQGQGGRIALAFVLSALVHVFNNFIYIFAARALGVELTAGQIFFVSSIQIFATIVPISVNGVGVREAAALGLYTGFFGVPAVLALLIPIVGFAVEMIVSAFGGLVLLVRRADYSPVIEVDEAEREETRHAMVEQAEVIVPELRSAAGIGLSAGSLGGVLVGLGEGTATLYSAHAGLDYGVLWYAALAYGIIGALIGLGGATALALFGRLIRRHRVDEETALGRYAGLIFAVLSLPIALFRIRRDAFGDQLVFKSKEGLLVLGGTLLAVALLGLVLSLLVKFASRARPFRFLGRAWGGPVVALGVSLLFVGVAAARPVPQAAASGRALPAAPTQANNILFIVVDTLRADALGPYGYAPAKTPNLERFAKDSVRYDQHFANASWTRPSFASMLTSRYPSNHGVMEFSSALSDEVITLPEALAEGGFYTSGVITNPNVTSAYNFQQGFDEYTYLEPSSVLGANDLQAKLLVVQLAKRVIQRFVPPAPGSAYQDATVVNERVLSFLDRSGDAAGTNPFFLFVGYMDPHDPYFEHPYNGVSYDKASNQNPDLEEAPRLRALYDGEVAFWDEHFGHLVAELKRRGVYDDMTIVITSDHGEEFGDHGGFWHGVTLYDEQVRVPLFVKYPANRGGGTVVRHFTQSVDLMPTLLADSGLPAVEGMQGGLLTSGSSEVFAEESHLGNVLRALRVREDGIERKLITANEGNPRGLPTVELFRVDVDPGEQQDLAATDAATVERLRTALDATEGRLREGAARPGQDVEMTCEACRNLVQLGYMSSCDEICD